MRLLPLAGPIAVCAFCATAVHGLTLLVFRRSNGAWRIVQDASM